MRSGRQMAIDPAPARLAGYLCKCFAATDAGRAAIRGLHGRSAPGGAGDYLNHGKCSIRVVTAATTAATTILIRGAVHECRGASICPRSCLLGGGFRREIPFLLFMVCELHGGQISAHSQGIGKGAEFIVRLPLDGVLALEPQPASAPSRPTHHVRGPAMRRLRR